ncbi:uncharacterized protein K444DRAFT_694502 [Hyaloscypha bicolor E]|uniref:Uncharacterized protein n=1 Tax=Hyaloscypha bicolor E TaxID=1095630 RepID=A0A2J6SZ25_9HELO|nr:uncharacterized protein K444DRAFT_694502 [Hyaloscypha bicolor E]PMD56025.1 hypothetical protein K444DRAFT_694502 [Hyaloscypha bicolor E]
MVQTYSTGKNIKIMVWGCFWDYGRSNYYIMDRNFESAKYGHLANSYLEICNTEVAPIFLRFDDSYLFIQDNTSIYRAYIVQAWFALHSII